MTALIELENGDKILADGTEVFTNYEPKNKAKLRFDAYTWTYFFLFPYKLSDDGSKWGEETNAVINSTSYNSQKLTFEPHTGDAPDDWYIMYSNKENHLIEYAAYIVTANKTKEEAETDPHAIKYSNYQLINGIPIAHSWSFWGWDMQKGITKQLGEAVISDVTFLESAAAIDIAKAELKK